MSDTDRDRYILVMGTTVKIDFRITREEKAQIAFAARGLNITCSALVRQAVLETVQRQKKRGKRRNTFDFRASLEAAKRGGSGGYRILGEGFGNAVKKTPQTIKKLQRHFGLVDPDPARNYKRLLEWLRTEFPDEWALVPTKRRRNFAQGLWEVIGDQVGIVRCHRLWRVS